MAAFVILVLAISTGAIIYPDWVSFVWLERRRIRRFTSTLIYSLPVMMKIGKSEFLDQGFWRSDRLLANPHRP
jgi:hypothetical protein